MHFCFFEPSRVRSPHLVKELFSAVLIKPGICAQISLRGYVNFSLSSFVVSAVALTHKINSLSMGLSEMRIVLTPI